MGIMKDGPVTEDHINSFGHIVHIFARLELIMQGIITRLGNADFALVIVLTAGLGYSGKRDALLSVLANTQGRDTEVETIKKFLGKFHKWNAVRNAVAHHSWKAGVRLGSIKPISIVVGGGSGKLKGQDPKEPDYTAEDLVEIGNELGQLYNDFVVYLDSVKLLPFIVQGMAANSSPTPSLPGDP